MAKIKQSKLNEIKGYNEYKKRKEEKEQKAQKEESAAQAASPSTSNTKTTSSTTSNKTNTTSNKTSTTSNATISSTTKGAKIKQSKLDSIKGYNAYKARREARERNAQVPPNSTPVADKTKLNDGYTIESIRENLGYSQTALEDSIKRLEESKNVLTSSENEVTNFLKKYGATAEDIHSKMATKYGAKLDTSGKYIFEDEQSYSDYQKEIAALGALYDQYNANMNQYNALYTQYQDSAVNYEDWYGRLEGYQPRDATLKDLLWNSLKQGYYNSIYGQESYKQMLGDENQAAAYKELLSGEDYQFETDNWLEKAVSGAANQLGQQYRQWTDPRSLASGTAFAGGAFALGQAGPQALVPEEVITVPGAFIAGMQAGSAASNFEIEGGLAYQEMLEQGISPEVARIIGLSVGGGNAALEALQADELIKGLKVFNNKQGYESVAELLYAELKRRFPNLANQVIQEVAQEGVTIGGTQLASYIDKGELAYTMPETLQRLGETALSSTLTFGLMDVPGATMNVAANKANVNRLGKIGSEYNVDAEAVIAEGLEMPKNTEAYQTAVELKAKVDAGQTVSDAELGRAVVANEMAIQQNQVTEEAAQPAEKAQKALENLARDAVAYRENFQQAEPTQSETVSEQATVPYNVMADTNPVRQKKVAETRSLEKKLGYGEEGLKLFKEIAAETNVDTDELMVRFDTPYQAGLTGLPMAKANLVDNFQTEAYNAGRMDNIARMAKDKESKPATIYSEAESGFDFTNAPSDLTQEQKDFAVFFNKAMGVKGEFNGYEGVNYNAKYSKSTGVVAFAQDFGIDSKLMKKLGSMEYQQKVEKLVETRGKSFIFYFAHEVADHVASNRAPAAMRAFNNAMYNYQQSSAGNENLARSKQAFYGDNKVDLSTEGAIEEVGADSILMLYDGDEKKFMDAMKRVLNGNDKQAKEGAKLYKNKLDEIIQKLKAWFRKLTGKENAEARANLKQGITELERLRDMFEQSIAEAAKNVKAARADAPGAVTALKDDVFYTDQNYSLKITDKKLIEFLENQEYIVTYKAMQQVGKNKDLHPPMAAKVKGPDGKYAWGAPSEIGAWQQATEDPSHITKFKEKNGETVGYYTLNKGNGKNVADVAYAPYEHSSNYVINDQFDEAYLRDNLVVVECHIPVSEMGGTYKAQYAHKATGIHNWKKGDVGNALAKHGKVRKVYLTRYLKPVRVLDDAEVAQKYKDILGDVAVPFNVVTPNLLAELEKIGVTIDYKGSKMYQGRERVAAEKASGKPAKKKKGADTGEQFSLKGERANLSAEDRASLQTAKQMKEDGKSNEEIYKATGWYTQSDGKWRTEFATNAMQTAKAFNALGLESAVENRFKKREASLREDVEDDFLTEAEAKEEIEAYKKRLAKDGIGSGFLPEFFDDEEMYSAYPFLRDVRLIFKSLNKKNTFVSKYAEYTPDGEIISIDRNACINDGVNVRGVLLHEIQHIIQRYEGFSKGTSLKAAGSFSAYESAGGEIEARDVESRLRMTPEERRATMPTQFSLKDQDYMNAVNAGDMETAQRMVDEAAKAAGYNSPKLYHGTKAFGFTKLDTDFSDDGISFFTTSAIDIARTYSNSEGERAISEKRSEEDYSVHSWPDFKGAVSLIRNWDDGDDIRKELWDHIESITSKANALMGVQGYFDYEDALDTVDEILEHLDLYGNGYAESTFEDYANDIYDVLERALDANAGNYALYGNIEGFLEIDAASRNWNNIRLPGHLVSEFNEWWNRDHEANPLGLWREFDTRAISGFAHEKGYPGVIIYDVWDDGGRSDVSQEEPGALYIFFNPQQQVKSADPVTYDDAGNVIPLSQRFNAENDDIRYSMKDSQGNTLSKEQAEFFKDSKVRDENGNLIPMYHGTNTPNFTVFDPSFSDDKLSMFFSSNPDVANSYTSLQDTGRNVDPYNLITENSSPEEFNRAQERVGGGLRVVKVTDKWLADIRQQTKEKQREAVAAMDAYIEALDKQLLHDAANDLRDLAERVFDGDTEVRKLSSALFSTQQKLFRFHTRAMFELERKAADLVRILEPYRKASEITASDIGKYVTTETQKGGVFKILTEERGFNGDPVLGDAKTAVKAGIRRASDHPDYTTGNRYQVYLNLKNPYVVDTGDDISGHYQNVALYHRMGRWYVTFTREDEDIELSFETDEGKNLFAKMFDTETYKEIAAKIEADEQTYRDDFGDLDTEYVEHEIAVEDVDVTYSIPGLWKNIELNGARVKTREVARYARDNGYDGVIFKNILDTGGYAAGRVGASTVAVAFDANQIKATSNLKPTSDPDIRYSIKSTAAAAGLDVTRDEKGKVVFKLDGKVVTKVTPEHIQKNSGLGGLITVAAIKGHITDAEAVTQYTAMADIMNMIMDTQDPDLVWAWVGASMFSALKKNADGQYGTTIDFTTVCRKTQDIITAMSRAMMKMKRGLSKDEVTKLQAELITEGSSVPCPVCYVFSRWAGIGSILDNMYRWQEKYDGYTDEQLRKRVDELTEKLGKGKVRDLKKMLREQDEEYDSLDHESEMLSLEKKQLTAKRKKAIRENIAHMLRSVDDRMKEVEKRIPQVKKRMSEIQASVAPELAWLLQVRTNPDYAKHGKVKPNVLFNLDDAATFAESYPLAWKYRTSRGPSAGKAILPYSDMRLGDMILGVDSNSATGNDLFANVTGQFTDEQMEALDKAIKRTKAQNLIGGQRFQSTSDFRYDYALDYLMAFFECQALGSKLQTYTKIIEFADMVAAVRGDVNLSVMPKNKGYITTSDGVNRLVFSSVTGIDFEAAQRANELHDSAQLILVGINDDHILAALEDSEETLGKHIGFVIPYHASGASINEFIRVLVSNLGESFTLNYYQDYSDVQSDKERSNATDAQKRRNELRSKLLKGKDGGKNWEPSADDLAFIRGESVDITGRSFADLRAVERKALSGNKAAIAEYESWTAGALWDLYNKMWVEGGAEYGVRLNTNQAKAVMPHEYWNKTVNRDKAYINGFLFRSYCYNLGLTPRFSGATVKGEKHGDFTDSKGYWKTLIDRPMYNNDGTYRDQQTVNVSSFQKDMLTQEYAKKHWDGYSVQEPDVVRAGRAADRFIEKSQNGQYSLKGEHEMRREIDRIRKEGAKAGKSRQEIENEVMGVVGPEYGKLLKTYGEIKRGERPYREISVPRLTEDDRKVSQTIRTILEAEATPDAAIPTIQEMITKGDFSYDVYTDKEARAAAEATIRRKGYETALADWLSEVKEGKVNKTNTALGWELYNQAATKGDLKTAMSVLNGMVQHQRNAAQALQATRILKKMAPDAQLYGIQRSVESLQEDLAKKYGDKVPDLKVDEELAKKLLKAKTDEERDEATKEIYIDIGRQMPSTFIDKWNAWRYLAMLGNPRTHVRNVVGNLGFAPVVAAKDLTATFIESVVSFASKGKLDRTKAMPNAKLLKAAWADYANVADEVTAGGKYSDSFMQNQYIQEGREIFKFKPLEKARKGNSAALEMEDMWFAQPHYAFALAQYCKAHGVTVEQLKTGKALGNARNYAIREAQKATYRDTNAFSQMVSELGRYSGDNKAKKGLSLVTEGILPFRKTPANILVRGIEYSPIGLLNGIKQALWDVSKGTKTGAEAIDSIAAGATGTVLLGLGVYLASQGLIRGAGGDDEKEKKFEELQGHQTYALELPNGKSITLDWLAPEVLPLFIGVNLCEMAREDKGESNLSDILTAVSNVTEPLLEMSCLQSLNDLFDSVGYAASGGGLSALPTILVSAATSYLTQAFPTILGQAERSAQDERMTTYTEKNGFLTSDMQYTIGKISAKIPGWDFQQIPYVDAWGRTESTGSRASNIANNFLNPAYTSQIETSEMEEELQRLHDEKGDEYSVLPSRPNKYFNVDGDRKDLTAEEYVAYATEKGQLSYDILTDLTGQKEYDKLPDAEKARAVEMAYEYANAIAKSKVSDYEPDSWVAKALEAEEFSGMDETEYILYKVALSMADQDNNGNNNYDNTEKAAAIASMPSLSDADIAVLLDSKTSYAAYDAGVDMRSLVGYIGEGNDVNVEKLIGAKEAGISEDTYFKYTDTLKAVDQPNSNGELGGAATNAEKAAAIAKMQDLDNEGIAYLWGTDQAHEAYSYGVDMKKYAQFKGVVGDFKGQDKQQQIKSYLKSMNLSAKDYLYLYGTVYSSVKDDADYLYYFGN